MRGCVILFRETKVEYVAGIIPRELYALFAGKKRRTTYFTTIRILCNFDENLFAYDLARFVPFIIVHELDSSANLRRIRRSEDISTDRGCDQAFNQRYQQAAFHITTYHSVSPFLHAAISTVQQEGVWISCTHRRSPHVTAHALILHRRL